MKKGHQLIIFGPELICGRTDRVLSDGKLVNTDYIMMYLTEYHSVNHVQG